jgi:ABC-type glycerol-3-phosphate transport system permease component
MILATLLCLFPVYFMIASTFKTRAQYGEGKWALPWPPTLENLSVAIGGEQFAVRCANSLLLTVGAVLFSTVLASLAAYAFARMPFRGKRTLFNLVTALMVVPPVAMVVPLFLSLVSWNLINTHAGVILIYVGLLMPFSVYLLTNFFKTIPQEIVEAACVDGCSTFQIFWRILLPLSGPAIMTLVVVNSLWVWNELLIALIFLQGDGMKTLMVGIAAMRSRHYVDIPVTMAGMLVATLPTLLLYLFGQRYFIRGLTSGAVK